MSHNTTVREGSNVELSGIGSEHSLLRLRSMWPDGTDSAISVSRPEEIHLKSKRSLLRQHNAPSTPSHPPRLLKAAELPAWYRDDPFIMSSYRPVSRSMYTSMRSLGYIHNESVNIYSHLIPATLLASSCLPLCYVFASTYPLMQTVDFVIFSFFLAAVLICLALSAAYHTFLNHSEKVCGLFLRCDYVGIVTLVLGNFVSGIRLGFFCEPGLAYMYWAMILSLSVFTAFLLLSPHFEGFKYRSLRLTAFIALGFSAFAPIIHGLVRFGWVQLARQSGLHYYLVEGALLLVGAAFYGSRWPERSYPGLFDVWGASHQIFHLLVVMATAVHFLGIKDAYEWNYRTPRCG